MKNNKKTVIVSGAIIGILIIACLAVIVFGSGGSDKKYAYIYSENVLLEIIDLSDTVNDEIRVESDNGFNIIRVSEEGICVSEADCPDKTCIRTGYTKNPLVPVICMPNRLEIVIKDSVIGVDGVTG